MSCESPLPDHCQDCAKLHHHGVHRQCRLCVDLGLVEDVFCDLNRSAQSDENNFECGAFQARLSVVKEQDVCESQPIADQSARRNVLAERLAALRQMRSSKVQYQKALFLQELERDPDAIVCQAKFHMAWSVVGRKPIFAEPQTHVKAVAASLLRKPAPSAADIELLWLAPDHLHIYCESDGTASPEEIVGHLKRSSEVTLASEFADILAPGTEPNVLWDDSYFVESIG